MDGSLFLEDAQAKLRSARKERAKDATWGLHGDDATLTRLDSGGAPPKDATIICGSLLVVGCVVVWVDLVCLHLVTRVM